MGCLRVAEKVLFRGFKKLSPMSATMKASGAKAAATLKNYSFPITF